MNSKALDKLTTIIERLKKVTSGGIGLDKISNQVVKFNKILKSIKYERLDKLSDSLSNLNRSTLSLNFSRSISDVYQLNSLLIDMNNLDFSSSNKQMYQILNLTDKLSEAKKSFGKFEFLSDSDENLKSDEYSITEVIERVKDKLKSLKGVYDTISKYQKILNEITEWKIGEIDIKSLTIEFKNLWKSSESVFNNVQTSTNKVSELFKDIATKMKTFYGAEFDKFKSWISKSISGIFENTSSFRKRMSDTLDKATSIFLNVKDRVSNLNIFGTLSDSILEKKDKFYNDFVSFFSPMAVKANEIFSGFNSLIGTKITDTFVFISEPFKIVSQSLLGVVSPLMIIVALFTAVTGALIYLWNTSEAFKTSVTSTFEGIKESYQLLWETTIEPISNSIVTMFESIINEAIMPLWEGFTSGIEKISIKLLEFWDVILKPIVDWFIVTFGPILSGVIESLSVVISGCLSAIGLYFGTAFEVIGTVVSGIIGVLTNVIDFIFGVFTGDWTRAWNGVKGIFENVWNTLVDVVSTIWNGILSIFGAGGKIFVGVVEGIAGVFGSIVNLMIDGVNRVIRLPFDGINGTLNWVHDVNILGFRPFYDAWSYNPISVPQIPKIPKYEKGTDFVPQTGLALLHRGERVIPAKQGRPFNQGREDNGIIPLMIQQNEFLKILINKDSVIELDGEKVSKAQVKSKYRLSRSLGNI